MWHLVYFCTEFQTQSLMKKLDKEQIRKLAEDPAGKVRATDPWWVILAKVVAYFLGLLLAGYGTAEAATMAGIVL